MWTFRNLLSSFYSDILVFEKSSGFRAFRTSEFRIRYTEHFLGNLCFTYFATELDIVHCDPVPRALVANEWEVRHWSLLWQQFSLLEQRERERRFHYAASPPEAFGSNTRVLCFQVPATVHNTYFLIHPIYPIMLSFGTLKPLHIWSGIYRGNSFSILLHPCCWTCCVFKPRMVIVFLTKSIPHNKNNLLYAFCGFVWICTLHFTWFTL